MEEQHPIPQQISSYQFKLVGDMSLKQFFQVGGGAIIALLFYASNINPLFKWPLVIGSFLLGIALAFFPVQDRPLTTWILAFFKSIYSPTVYNWQNSGSTIAYFQTEPIAGPITPPLPKPTLKTNMLPPEPVKDVVVTEDVTKLDKKEEEMLNKISQQFSIGETGYTNQPIPAGDVSATQSLRDRDVHVPEAQKPTVNATEKPIQEAVYTNAATNYASGSSIRPMNGSQISSFKKATFVPEAAPPNPPTQPNIVVGQVTDMNGAIVENAILEIRDEFGRSVRALRTNKLGHFMIVTPLANGKYQMLIEKEGFDFTPITFETNGTIIPPIGVKGDKSLKSN